MKVPNSMSYAVLLLLFWGVFLSRHSHKQGESRAFTSALVMGWRGIFQFPPPSPIRLRLQLYLHDE